MCCVGRRRARIHIIVIYNFFGRSRRVSPVQAYIYYYLAQPWTCQRRTYHHGPLRYGSLIYELVGILNMNIQFVDVSISEFRISRTTRITASSIIIQVGQVTRSRFYVTTLDGPILLHEPKFRISPRFFPWTEGVERNQPRPMQPPP